MFCHGKEGDLEAFLVTQRLFKVGGSYGAGAKQAGLLAFIEVGLSAPRL